MMTEKLSAGRSLEIFSSLLCSYDLLFQNMSKNLSFLSNLMFLNTIVAGRIGQAMGPPV
jgi:hypothetical protein